MKGLWSVVQRQMGGLRYGSAFCPRPRTSDHGPCSGPEDSRARVAPRIMTKPRPLCIYHKNCLDGRGAAAVVARKEPDCEFLPMQYSSKRPSVLDRKLYIVDFCLTLADMRGVRAEASEVIWLDHHASQQPVYDALGWGVLDTSECGASLTWKHLFPGETPPRVIDYIKDKDLWRWQLPDSRAIAAGLEVAFPKDSFRGLLDADLAHMAELGRPLLDALAKRVSEAVRSGIAISEPFGLKGMRAFAVSCNKDLNEIGDHICMPITAGGLGYDMSIVYYQKQPKSWVHSLRSAPATVDCGAVAALRGGGGHPNAACFIAKEPILDPAVLTRQGSEGAKPTA